MTGVVDIADYRVNWRPVKVVCFHCGHAWTAVVPEAIDATSRLECPQCELSAGTVTREPPVGWQHMSDEELAEHAWGGD